MQITHIKINEGGTEEAVIPIAEIVIPDLWHLSQRLDDEQDRKAVLACWRLCHDMLRCLKAESEASQ